jgi:hypothetical protein
LIVEKLAPDLEEGDLQGFPNEEISKPKILDMHTMKNLKTSEIV